MAVFRQRRLLLTLCFEGRAQEVIRSRVVRLLTDGLLVFSYCTIVIARSVKCKALGVVRHQWNHFTGSGDRVVAVDAQRLAGAMRCPMNPLIERLDSGISGGGLLGGYAACLGRLFIAVIFVAELRGTVTRL